MRRTEVSSESSPASAECSQDTSLLDLCGYAAGATRLPRGHALSLSLPNASGTRTNAKLIWATQRLADIQWRSQLLRGLHCEMDVRLPHTQNALVREGKRLPRRHARPVED